MNNEDDTAAKLAGYNLKIKLIDGEVLYTNFASQYANGSIMTKIIMTCFSITNKKDPAGLPIPGQANIPVEKFIPIQNGIVMLEHVMYVREL